MKKLKALAMITLTMTSMIPLTANAAVIRPYSQCFGNNNARATYEAFCSGDVKSRLEQLGFNCNTTDWSSLQKSFNNGNCYYDFIGNDNNNCDTDTDNNNNGDTDTDNGNTDNGNTDNGNTNNGNTDDGNTGNDSTSNDSYTKQVVDLVNTERAKEGLSPLTIDDNAAKAADIRAKEIQTKFDHTRPNGSSFSSVLRENGVSFSGAGENIAWGQRSPQEVMTAWMNSAGHRANIMNPNFKHIGVGNQENSGTQYWVQLFTY
ncbi:CAP domain-containing protein [Clostridium sp. E02]|uniref:CAP domain-containing protein n=1 Tax=Clostridium sp. E02 TaxID=2487134 RepID=UPI001FAA3FF5|nr:CAP domain-containing protein [Clostridium sp. E02]